ncbi:diguanylate cyclase [Sphingomonas sp. Leaf339]|uniref:GGDEF domain-containing response regulator n=1 Tax=Sphingomonas sp. Leaf339 TaxID=1736343 RepID=UPI0006FA6ECF|nr:diguanylate cyclase [Sphingomonas sp. Leaf339]KQU55903.1 diguanylate cyclase [Sphingomonas sp. Leaf339]
MTRFREQDRKAPIHAAKAPSRDVFLIEDSVALGMLLQSKLRASISANVVWLKTYAEAARALSEQAPALAITGINLPDAPDGEIIDLLAQHDVPTILFTATLDRKARERFTSPNIIDYFFKNANDIVDHVVRTVARFTDKLAPSVLIVDDMESGRSVLAQLLRHQHYRIFQAASGAEALRILADDDAIQLVITDHHMADMDGHELTRRIRARYAADRIRIIGISASSDPFLSAQFLKAGASDFIYRPFITEEVRYRIESNIDTLGQIKHLRFLADRDPLTSLYNRRAFFERAHPMVDDLRANDGQGSIAILDIDHFKKVNDRYGHDAGDKVIKQVARVLEDCCARGNAITARFGGEEFIILFTDLPQHEVHARCDAIRTTIENIGIPYNDAVLRITASIGAALIQPAEGLDNNLNAADQMLYMAKNGGRNRVVYDAVYC